MNYVFRKCYPPMNLHHPHWGRHHTLPHWKWTWVLYEFVTEYLKRNTLHVLWMAVKILIPHMHHYELVSRYFNIVNKTRRGLDCGRLVLSTGQNVAPQCASIWGYICMSKSNLCSQELSQVYENDHAGLHELMDYSSSHYAYVFTREIQLYTCCSLFTWRPYNEF